MNVFYIFNTYLTFILLILINNNINSQKFITLPFEEYFYITKTNYPTIFDFFESQFHSNIYTPLKIGTPSQTLLTFIKTENTLFLVKDDASFYNKTNYGYNPKISSSFRNITAIDWKYFFYNYSIINETINFCKDESCKNLITFQNFQINLVPLESYDNKEKPVTGQLGFLLSSLNYGYDYLKTIIQLKNGGCINSYKISIKYKDEHKGFITFGEYPHIYDPNNFKENQKLTAFMKNDKLDYYLYHRLKMYKIYFYNGTEIVSFLTKNLEIKFYFEYGIILGPMNYYNKIKEIFFDKYDNICTQNDINVGNTNLSVYSCQTNNFNIKEFPSLYFYNNDMNYTFELNYNDLFYKNGDEYIFLIAFDTDSFDEFWKIGKPFFKKYQLTFDFDTKTISYYNTKIKRESEEDGTGKIILIVFIIIICAGTLVAVGYFFGKKLNETRKKRANELGDDFDYNGRNNENNDQLYETLNNK